MTTLVCTTLATVLVISVAVRFRPPSGRIVTMRTVRRDVAADHAGPSLRRARRSAITVAVVVLFVGVAGGLQSAAIVAMSAIVRRPLRARRARRRRVAELTATFPDFVDLLVLAAKAGCSVPQALDSTAQFASAPIADAVRAVSRRRLSGEPLAHAIESLTDELGDIARPLVSSLALADRYGTPLVPVLDRLADEARSQRRRNAEVAARQLPIRLSFPLVGCTLPSFVLLTIVPLMAGTLSSFRGLQTS